MEEEMFAMPTIDMEATGRNIMRLRKAATGLRMMLVAEAVQIRLHQFGSQLTVGGGNRPDLTTCHFHGRAALVYINMGSFRTED